MKILVAILLLLPVLNCSSQASSVVKKGYAYARDILPGTRKVQMDEKGNMIEENPPIRKEYFIYITTLPKKNIRFSKIFIEGRAFSIQTDSVTKTPVILYTPFTNEKFTKDTLVPKTGNRVWKLTTLQPAENLTAGSSIKKMIGENALVVEYVYKNKIYYFTLPGMKRLPPLALP